MDPTAATVARLRGAAHKQKLSYRDIARLSGGLLSHTSVGRILSGAVRPNQSSLMALCSVLQVEPVLETAPLAVAESPAPLYAADASADAQLLRLARQLGLVRPLLQLLKAIQERLPCLAFCL